MNVIRCSIKSIVKSWPTNWLPKLAIFNSKAVLRRYPIAVFSKQCHRCLVQENLLLMNLYVGNELCEMITWVRPCHCTVNIFLCQIPPDQYIKKSSHSGKRHNWEHTGWQNKHAYWLDFTTEDSLFCNTPKLRNIARLSIIYSPSTNWYCLLIVWVWNIHHNKEYFNKWQCCILGNHCVTQVFIHP